MAAAESGETSRSEPRARSEAWREHGRGTRKAEALVLTSSRGKFCGRCVGASKRGRRTDALAEKKTMKSVPTSRNLEVCRGLEQKAGPPRAHLPREATWVTQQTSNQTADVGFTVRTSTLRACQAKNSFLDD